MTQDIVVKAGGVPHDGITKASLAYGAEDAVRRATLEVAEQPGARVFWPHLPVEIYVEGELWLSGQVKRISPRVQSGTNTTVVVESKSAKAVKTAAQAPDYALKKKTIGDAAKTLFEKVGVPVEDLAQGKAFNWKWAPGERAFDVVERQARSANLLLMGAANGGVTVAKGIRGSHAGVLSIPGNVLDGAHADLGSDNDFEETVALGQKREGDKKDALRPKATAKNAKGDGTVSILLNETEFDAQDLTTRAKARRDRRRASDVSCTLPVPGWRDKAGKLWQPAYTVYVSAFDVLAIDQDMAIKSITLKWEKLERGGVAKSAELNLVDPPALGGKKGKSKSGEAWGGDTSEPKYEEDA